MKNMMKTVFALVAFSAVAVQADNGDAASKKPPAMSTIPNPSARWGVTSGADLFVTAEGLYFKLAQDTAPFAYSVDADDDINVYHCNTEYEWGFRVAAGYNLPHDGWDLVATYSRFNCSTTTQVVDPVGGDLYTYTATGFSFDSGTSMDSVTNVWDVDYNVLDVELGRQFFVSKFLRLRPKFGLRNLWLDNDQTLTCDTSPNVTSGVNPIIANQETFWGMGVLAGLDTVWGLGEGFAIYGNLGLSALFGYFDPDQTVTNAGLTDFSTHQNLSKHQDVTKGNVDLAIGLRWDRNFSDDRFHLGINVGFEEHIYFNMNRNYFGDANFGTFNGISGRDFTLSGLAFGARFDF